ncbi:putative OTU domain, FHY3/FAR1 family protein [Helianthus debilis subsp. tardiflorus]
MGACAKVFPDASRLICRWHIQRNVMKHRKGAFTDEDWKNFLSFWGTLIESPSKPIYEYHLRNMRKRLVECKRSIFKYVYDNWLKDYKEMFVFVWTDKRRNFGNRTTNRVESQHANLKRYVLDRSSLDRVVGCVRDIVETQFGEIRKTFRESIEKTMNHHKHPMFQHLLGKVSHTALDLLPGEAIRKLDVLERFHSSCGCQMWHSCGLPCACRIEKYMCEERPIQLEDIDVFWRKLNFQSCKLIDDDVDVVEELNIVRQQLESHPPAQQKSLMSKIKAVLTPKKSTKKPPVVQQNTRGRPTTKQVQQRLDEASRINEELRRSSFGDANMCFEGSRQSKYDKPRHSSYVPSQASQQSVIRSQKPKASLSRSKSSKKKETRDDHGFPLIIGDEYVGIIERFKSAIPPVFHPYVSFIRDAMSDGHCGFRSVVVGLGMDQSSWGLIRRDLVQEMDQNESI